MADQNNSSPTSFLDLPAELRNRIYEMSGCLKRLKCNGCHKIVTGDHVEKHKTYCPARKNVDLRMEDAVFTFPIPMFCTKIPNTSPRRFRAHYDDTFFAYGGGRTTRHAFATPALSKVSRQVRSETLPMFYGGLQFMIRHDFRRSSGGPQLKWLEDIGLDQAAMLRRICLEKGGDWWVTKYWLKQGGVRAGAIYSSKWVDGRVPQYLTE